MANLDPDVVMDEVAQAADEIDSYIRNAMIPHDTNIIVPALAWLFARYVVYEAGGKERVQQGLTIAMSMVTKIAAIETKLQYDNENLIQSPQRPPHNA